jgi:hypothetical protein
LPWSWKLRGVREVEEVEEVREGLFKQRNYLGTVVFWSYGPFSLRLTG